MNCSGQDCPGLPTEAGLFPAPAGPAEKDLITQLLAGLDHPEERIGQVVVGQRFVAVRAGSRLGLSSTLGARPNGREIGLIQNLAGERLALAARLLEAESLFCRSVGLAALNAALEPPKQTLGFDAGELAARWGGGGEVAVVGDFPFIDRLSQTVGRLHLLELKDRPGGLPQAEWARVLAGCKVVVITSTALLTQYLAWFLQAAPQARKILVGPSTPWSGVLFSHRADVLAGSLITNPAGVLTAVGRDLSYREIKRAGAAPALWPARPDLLRELEARRPISH